MQDRTLPLCQECCIQKKAEEGAESRTGRAYYDSICDMTDKVQPFREMLIFVQKCCHKNFYISENARYT